MGSQAKTGEGLAKEIAKIQNEMSEVAGGEKVLTVTTDRASANKVSWTELEASNLKGGPDTVHVHSSMVTSVVV